MCIRDSGNVELIAAFKELVAAFAAKAAEFSSLLKMGRTQLQDAVPMTLGQEFKAYARTLSDELAALERVQDVLHEVNMGATAIGTGLNLSLIHISEPTRQAEIS